VKQDRRGCIKLKKPNAVIGLQDRSSYLKFVS